MPITIKYDAWPIYAGANLVASTSEFRRVVSAASEAAALNSIHALEADSRRVGDGPMPSPRPRAIWDWEDRLLQKAGTGGPTDDSGRLWLSFEFLQANLDLTGAQNPPTRNEVAYAFMGSYGEIIHQMFENAPLAPDTRLQITELELSVLPRPERHKDTNEEFWSVAFLVSWR